MIIAVVTRVLVYTIMMFIASPKKFILTENHAYKDKVSFIIIVKRQNKIRNKLIKAGKDKKHGKIHDVYFFNLCYN